MINVLITDPISDNGIKILEDKGINIFYNPDSKKSSSSSKRGRRSSSNTNDKNDPIFKEISNPFLKSFFTTLHTFMGKISKVQFKYDLSQSHTHNNVLADQDIDYMFEDLNYYNNDHHLRCILLDILFCLLFVREAKVVKV